MLEQSLEPFGNKNQFLKSKYPKILSYPPGVKNENNYVFTIKDIEVLAVTKIELKLTLPEIKGVGKVSYIPNYPFLLIKKFEILIKNQNDECFKPYETLDGEELMSRFYLNKKNSVYKNTFGGENDYFCSTRTGTYNDCIIFPSREIIVPISISNHLCLLFPTTDIEFRVSLYGLKEIIMYNEIFSNQSLIKSISEFDSMSKNLRLSFMNTDIVLGMSSSIKLPIRILRNEKTTSYENNTNIVVSDKFKTIKHISFYNKSNIFDDDGVKFIIPFGPSLNKKTLINNWVKRILKDLIVITDLDLTLDQNKATLGFQSKSEFQLVKNNKITFLKDISYDCNIYINNIPEGHKVYYHRNILSFSRRHNKKNILNISELFYEIKGSYFQDGEVCYLMDEIKHDIDIYHISIPVNIWNDQKNTADGDLRSIKSRNDDFYYKNRFIYGMDILSQDSGFDTVSVLVGRETLRQYYQATYSNLFLPHAQADYSHYYNDENNYPNRLEFFTSHIYDSHFVSSDDNINFNSINVEIQWKKYNDYDPISLYSRRPSVNIAHVYNVEYDSNRHYISIQEII